MQKSTLGCVDVENGTKHYGVVKDKKLEGLGLCINRQLIESGKYVDGQLEGQGRRLDLENKTLYEGEFLARKYDGKGRKLKKFHFDIYLALGKLYEWNTKTVRTGTFTQGVLVKQDSETSFSIESLSKNITSLVNTHLQFSFIDSTLPLAFLANPLNIQQFSRNFNDIFNAVDLLHSSKPLLRSIQETLSTMNSTKFIPRDPLIDYEDLPKNSLARLSLLTLRQMAATAAENTKNLENSRGYVTQHLQERLNSMRSSRRQPRSNSCEKDLEPTFSRTFSADITNRRPFVSFNHGLIGYNSNLSFHNQSAKTLPHAIEQPPIIPHRHSVNSDISILSRKTTNRSGIIDDPIAYNRKGSNNPLETSSTSTRINTAATPATAKNAGLTHFPSSAGVITQNLLSSAIPTARTAGRSDISTPLLEHHKFHEQDSPSLGVLDSGRSGKQLKRDSRGSHSTADFRSPSVGTLNPEQVVVSTPQKAERSNPPDVRQTPVSEEKSLKRNSLGHKSAVNLNISNQTPPPSDEKTQTSHKYTIAQDSSATKSNNKAVDKSLNMSKTSQQSSSSAKKATPNNKAAGRSATPNMNKNAQNPQTLQQHPLVYVGTTPYARKSSLSTLKSESSVTANDSMNRSRRSESNMVFNAEKLDGSNQKEKRTRGAESPVVQVNLAGFSNQPFTTHHTSHGIGTFETMESADLKNRLLRKNDLTVSTNKALFHNDPSNRSRSPITTSKANIDISVLKSAQLSGGLTSAELEDHILRGSLEKSKLGIDQSPISKAGTRNSFISDLSQVMAPETVPSAGVKSGSGDINKKISNEFGIGMLSTKEIFSALGKKLQNSDMSPVSPLKNKETTGDVKTREGKSKIQRAFNLAIGERTKKREDSHGENPTHTVTFERRNKNSTPTEPSAKRRNNIDTDREKDRVGSGSNSEVMKTPSFSLTDQKIFKFGLPEVKPETPQKAGRYTVSSVNSSMSKVPHHRRLGSDPKIVTMSPNKHPYSPYKIDSRLSRSISPNKDQHNHSFSSAQGLHYSHNHFHHHHHDQQFGSPGSSYGYYPVKRTCDPKLEVSYYDSFISGIKAPSSCKHSPQKWSPIKHERGSLGETHHSASPLKHRSLCHSVGNVEAIFLQDNNVINSREKISARSNKTNNDLVKYKEDNSTSQVGIMTASSRPSQTPTPRKDLDAFTSPVKSQGSSKATSTVQFELTSSEPLTPTKGQKHTRKHSNLSNHSNQVISQTNTRPGSLQRIRNAEVSSSAASLLHPHKDKKVTTMSKRIENNGMVVTFGKNSHDQKVIKEVAKHVQQITNHWPNHVSAEDILKRRSSAASDAKKFSFGVKGLTDHKESVRSSIKEEWESPKKANKKKDTKKIHKKVAEEKPLSAFSHEASERNHHRQTANFGGDNKLEVPKAQIVLVADETRRRSELLKELETQHANLMSSIAGSMRSEIQKEGDCKSIHSEIHNVGLQYEKAHEADIEPWSLQRQRNQAALLQNYLDVEVRGSFNADVDRSGASSEKYYTKYEEPDEEDEIPEEKTEGVHDNLTNDTRLQKRKLYVYN